MGGGVENLISSVNPSISMPRMKESRTEKRNGGENDDLKSEKLTE